MAKRKKSDYVEHQEAWESKEEKHARLEEESKLEANVEKHDLENHPKFAKFKKGSK